MAKEAKYYYTRHDVKFASRQQPHLSKWLPEFTLDVEENVDWRQCIQLDIYKLNRKDSIKPASDEFAKVKPVIKEIFLSHYTLALKFIHEAPIDEGEFYIYQRSKDWYQVNYFSKNEKEKLNIKIDFRDGIEDLWLQFTCFPGHKERPECRKKANLITEEKFRQFLNLTIQFFYDPDSFPVFLEDYIKNFRLLCEGDNKIEGFIISAEKSFEAIFQQLELRKEYIEKRLIENDADSTLDRAKLRGELEGINYAIKTINSNK
jgi:hypothetical protein